MRITLTSAVTLCLLPLAAAWAQAPAYTLTSDIPYGDHPRQTLDVYTPTELTDTAPVLVYLHGGGFVRGDKTQAIVCGPQFAAKGVVVVSPNYRINAAFPSFLEDAAKAVAHVHRTIRTSIGKPRPIIVSGWSAGAYIGAKLSYDARYLQAETVPSGVVDGFIGIAGPYRGGLCAGSRCPKIFPPGTEADWPAAAFVDSDDPPMLLIQGSRDRFVDIENLQTLARAARQSGLDVDTLIVEAATHTGVRDDMGVLQSDIHRAMIDFILQVVAE